MREVIIKTTGSISVVIPCRNEEHFIGKCLDSILTNDFSKDMLEVFVVDGMSDDNTRAVIQDYELKYPFIKMLSNERKVTPIAMNMGIKAAKGEYIIILSSHSEIDPFFLKNNIEGFEKHDADCIGGTLVTLPANNTVIAESIALAISHPFGIGNAHFRIGSSEQRYVDTVPFGCYKKQVLHKIGLFDEDLVRNQDDELNLRLLNHGGKILLLPAIKSNYHARDSLRKLWKMYYQYGHFKPLVAHKVGGVLTWRQLIPALLVSMLTLSGLLSFIVPRFFIVFVSICLAYLACSLFFSASIAIRKGVRHFLCLPVVFATVHFSYGIGYLRGVWDFILFKKQNKKTIKDIPLTR